MGVRPMVVTATATMVVTMVVGVRVVRVRPEGSAPVGAGGDGLLHLRHPQQAVERRVCVASRSSPSTIVRPALAMRPPARAPPPRCVSFACGRADLDQI